MQKFLLNILLIIFYLACPDSTFAQLDSSWTLTVGGQSVQANADGSFRIPNVSAPDLNADFEADEFVQLFGSSTKNGVTKYAFSDFFRIQSGSTVVVPRVIITDNPPPAIDSLRLETEKFILDSFGENLQLKVLATLSDKSELDVSDISQWTTYRSSNEAILSVSESGMVTAHSEGNVIVVAQNQGAVSTIQLKVLFEKLVVAEGLVFLDANPVSSARVGLNVGGSTVTDNDGRFKFAEAIPVGQEFIANVEYFSENGSRYTGKSNPILIQRDGLNDLGIIELSPCGRNQENQINVLTLSPPRTMLCENGRVDLAIKTGNYFSRVREILLDHKNFGVEGVVQRGGVNLTAVHEINNELLEGTDVVLLSNLDPGEDLTETEKLAILDFVHSGGGFFYFENQSAENFGPLLNSEFQSTEVGSTGIAEIVDFESIIVDGPFGVVDGPLQFWWHIPFLKVGLLGSPILVSNGVLAASYKVGLGKVVLINDEEWAGSLSFRNSCAGWWLPEINREVLFLNIFNFVLPNEAFNYCSDDGGN